MPAIFESPDGGNTVYAREVGSIDRRLVRQDHIDHSLHDEIEEAKLWGAIRRKAKTHPGLAAELERVIMLYHLIKEENG